MKCSTRPLLFFIRENYVVSDFMLVNNFDFLEGTTINPYQEYCSFFFILNCSLCKLQVSFSFSRPVSVKSLDKKVCVHPSLVSSDLLSL